MDVEVISRSPSRSRSRGGVTTDYFDGYGCENAKASAVAVVVRGRTSEQEE